MSDTTYRRCVRLILMAAILLFAATLPSQWAQVTPIVMHADGSLRVAAAPTTPEMDVATRNMQVRRASIPPLAKAGPWASGIAAIADEATTHAGLSRGCKEVGAIKNTAVRVIVKVLVVIANWALVEYGDGSKDWVPWVSAAAWGLAAYHNSKVKC